jgi:RNA polymerase sigma factor (sigma-70 family)
MPDQNDPQTRDQALRRLLDDFARTETGRLRGVAGRAGLGGPARDDAVQQGFLAFPRSFPGDPDDRACAFSYLARSVQTAAWHILRADGRHERRVAAARAAHEPAGPDLLEGRLAADEVEWARALLSQLPAEERAVLFLGAAGFSPEEIAERLGLSKRQVRKRVTKANRRLRELGEP